MTQQLNFTASPSKDMLHHLFHTGSFMNPASLLDGLTPEQASTRPESMPHSVAEVVAHANFWLNWILNISRGGTPIPTPHATVGWPEVSQEGWETLKQDFLMAISAHQTFTQAELDRPLFEQPHYGWEKHSVGSALADIALHTAHHLGQVVSIRQALKLWPPPSGPYTW
ncbi:DinB family protein [Deinococcus misasensis]|uniref:DinB family protein n=1 Tax=Deinococcus misasensis TaxID=392413 RepID=UPI00068E177B|nr:DinB family protein [Deinococcus misasensis]